MGIKATVRQRAVWWGQGVTSEQRSGPYGIVGVLLPVSTESAVGRRLEIPPFDL